MKKILILAGLIVALVIGALAINNSSLLLTNSELPLISTDMQISSPSFSNSDPIPSKFTCDGENINPKLEFNNIPEDTVSLALIMYDPDSPIGDWVHWTLWNIPSHSPGIEQDSTPFEATAGMTTFDEIGYGGPCPGTGEHRYIFELYALSDKVGLDSTASREDLMAKITDITIEKAELIGTYKRK